MNFKLDHHSLIVMALCVKTVWSFNILDFSHYMDYLPTVQDGTNSVFDDFRTAATAPTLLKNRKMEIGNLKVGCYLVS